MSCSTSSRRVRRITSAPVCIRWCKKREKNRRLDTAVAGTSKIQSLHFVTTTAGEGGEPVAAESARRGMVVRELTGRLTSRLIGLCFSYRHITKRNQFGNPLSWSMPPKRTVCYQQRKWQHAHFLGNTCTFWSTF